MKIKKKELRKREAQLPINYPDPDVLPNALPGGPIDLATEMVQVEILCKRLAHNEVTVRDAVLAELPHYLERLTGAMAEMESSYETEIAEVRDYFGAHPKAPNPYHYENLPLALQQFRQKAVEQDRDDRRRRAVREHRHQLAEERRSKQLYGRYGASTPTEAVEGEEDALNVGPKPPRVYQGCNLHREKYTKWMEAWCDVELVFLKLCRGIHYCLWHSDKPLVQLACAQKIADLLHAPQTIRCKVLFYGALFRVLAREWPKIDRYRMDKYLALVRRMVFAYVKLVKDIHDSEETLATTGASPTKQELSKPTAPRLRLAKRQAGSKRDRSTAETEGETENSSADSASAHRKAAQSIPDAAVTKYIGDSTTTANAVKEIFFILQRQIFPSSPSVGLTMHMCDVAFDELVRAELGANLFLVLAVGIPLYAMSQGNYIEKRVLDNFFPPMAGGVYAQRRIEQLAQAMMTKASTSKKLSGKQNSKAGAVASPDAVRAEAEEAAATEARTVMQEIALWCRKYAVARGVAHEVRPMFSEAELIMRQSANPESFEKLTHTARRRRLERELEEVDGTREKVRNERQALRTIKSQDRQHALREKVKVRKTAMVTKMGREASGISNATLRKQILAEEKRASRKPVHNTKRKKAYHLTKEDLYGDGDAGSDGD